MLYSFVWPNYVRDLGGTEREIGLLSSLMFATAQAAFEQGVASPEADTTTAEKSKSAMASAAAA